MERSISAWLCRRTAKVAALVFCAIFALLRIQQETLVSVEDGGLLFNCSNIAEININTRNVHGKGVTKHAFLGRYHGSHVLVKMVTGTGYDVTRCLSSNRSSTECYAWANMKLLKEIMLHLELRHANLVQLLGFCVRSEETEALSLSEHGIIGVYEYAVPLTNVESWSLSTRLTSAWELLDLLSYLEQSPLGSLLVADLKRSHLLLRPPHSIVITDLDDVTSVEPKCSSNGSCDHHVECRNGRCSGYNARHNLLRFHSVLLSDMLHCNTQSSIKQNTSSVCHNLSSGHGSASAIQSQLSTLLRDLNENT
ncbi:hypothetical protein CAPTEDRAFT_214880 [Capitella teleta]|uniref:FAM69 protein-kinase domain-containing protein n=1 Tax=Capitella teleta TaxID=283909 RepID=R7U6D4_CAPTE|nr:hypothetical protein CAPTEDRAFT_214880 [Capitella teleta]|eukprot:ELU01681.1 hypothetical protein CAPTEDRAFT_214880 [Capitella teleta]